MKGENYMARRTVMYTSNVLNTLYGLLSSDEKPQTESLHEKPKKESSKDSTWAVKKVMLNNKECTIGLCTKNSKAYVLTPLEKTVIDMLLSWKELTVDDEKSDSKNNTTIMLSDIDWLRDRYKKNQEHIKIAHDNYKKAFEQLANLRFIYEEQYSREDNSFPLLEYSPIMKENELIGIEYNLGKLEQILSSSKQRTTLNGNAFKYRLNEEMKYFILRYLVTSIFMNRVKSKAFTRTHKSIVSALVTTENGRTVSYYDALFDKKYPHKYLKRYLLRLEEVLKFLKEIGYISAFTIEPITTLQELKTGAGLVKITTSMSKKRLGQEHTCQNSI